VFLIKSLKRLRRPQLSIMQQFRASAFYTVVRWHKLGEVNNKYISHICIVFAIYVPRIIKFGGDFTEFWQNKLGHFWHTLYTCKIRYLFKCNHHQLKCYNATDITAKHRLPIRLYYWFLRAKAECFARLWHRLGVRPSVRLSVRMSVCHTRDLYQNGAS